MKILLIQTAFIGDVILATSLIELVHKHFPEAQIDFLLRKGNESLLKNNPNIKNQYVWDKSKHKTLRLIKLALKARKENYDYAINIQRFFNSGLFIALSNAKVKIGFKQNPLSFFYQHKIEHKIPYKTQDSYLHEVQRNSLLLSPLLNNFKIPQAKEIPPKLYLSNETLDKVICYQQRPYLVLAPASVWFTKQWSKEKWIELKQKLYQKYDLYFIGGPDDKDFIKQIIQGTENCFNLCGELNLPESAALMIKAQRVIVNDSAPLHLASSVQAKTTAIFCSTVSEFGYGPLATDSTLIQLSPRLDCMPCGLHGKKQCPLGHFKCSKDIATDNVIKTIS